jgi:3-phenylpropionate/trans-cinnamate dioxygenase ferredoxin subunit
MSATDVCALTDIADGAVQRFVIGERAIAVVRIGEAVYAIGDVCSHANVSLSGGEVMYDTKELECPKHGSAFSLETGKPNTFPATQPVPVYVAKVVDGRLIITVEEHS